MVRLPPVFSSVNDFTKRGKRNITSSILCRKPRSIEMFVFCETRPQQRKNSGELEQKISITCIGWINLFLNHCLKREDIRRIQVCPEQIKSPQKQKTGKLRRDVKSCHNGARGVTLQSGHCARITYLKPILARTTYFEANVAYSVD